MTKIRLEDYQYNDLIEEKLFINKYDLDFKYLYEMNRYWKEFCFDLLNELYRKDLLENLYSAAQTDLSNIDYLLIFLKNNYKIIIEENKLEIDFRDYIELNDYATLREWLKEKNHLVEQNENGIFLIQE